MGFTNVVNIGGILDWIDQYNEDGNVHGLLLGNEE